MSTNIIDTTPIDGNNMSDEPGAGRSPQASPSVQGGTTEFDNIMNRRFPTASSLPSSPSAATGSWQDVYRQADPDAQRRMFDQQMTGVTGCGFIAEGAARPQPPLNPMNPYACAGVEQSGQAFTQQSRFSQGPLPHAQAVPAG